MFNDKIFASQQGRQPFREWDGVITTTGVDYSGKIFKRHENGIYQIWKKNSGSCFAGIGCQIYVKPWLVLVRVEDNVAYEIEGMELCRSNSRSCEKYLVEKMNDLCTSDN